MKLEFELDYIEKLTKLVSENKLSELSLEEGDRALIIKREKEIITTQTTVAPVQVAQPIAHVAPPALPSVEVKATKGNPITSPMVGTFYLSPAPGAPAFVEIGKIINAGQVVCIIEAMKLMNEIESDISGKITEICVQDGQPVEYGQVLMYVE